VSLLGSPFKAAQALTDPELPFWFKVTMLFVGVLCWGSLILELAGAGK
jgi:hypothetical protein